MRFRYGTILSHITIKNGQAIKAWIKGPVEIIGEYEINYEME